MSCYKFFKCSNCNKNNICSIDGKECNSYECELRACKYCVNGWCKHNTNGFLICTYENKGPILNPSHKIFTNF